MTQITHETDPGTGHLRQVVSPATLRHVLDLSGDDYTRPDDFLAEDEWYTEDDPR
jgi:hypothetical protein